MKRIWYPHVSQHENVDCGAACLSMICEYYGYKGALGTFREMMKTDSEGSTIYGMIEAANKIGFDAESMSGNYEELQTEISNGGIRLPFVAHVISEEGYLHYVVVYDIEKKGIVIGDPASKILKISVEDFKKNWTGYIVNFVKNENFHKGNDRKKAIYNFIDIVMEQSDIMGIIIILSIFISLISILGTLVFQYIIDVVCASKISSSGSSQMYSSDGVNTIVVEFITKYIPNFSMVCMLIIGLYIFQSIIQFVRELLTIKMSKKINLPVLTQYYSHVMGMSLEFFETRKTGDIMSRLSDASNVCQKIVEIIFSTVIDGLLLVMYSVIMYSINPILFLIAIFIVLIYAMVIACFNGPLKRTTMNIMKQRSNITSYFKESIDGIETVKVYDAKKEFICKSKDLFERFMEHVTQNNVVSAMQENLVLLITSIGIIILLWSGVSLVEEGIITCGTLITFYVMLGRFLAPIENLMNLQPQIQSLLVAIERVNDVMGLKMESDLGEKNISEENTLYLENIHFRYGFGREILKGCNFFVESGSKIAIVGESGCGKSTLAKILTGLYTPESGIMMLGDKDISLISKKELRKRVSYVSQKTSMFSGSFRDNLLMFGKYELSDEHLIEVCKKCSLDSVIDKMPFGLDTIIEEGGVNFSEGEKQRIAVARALISGSNIVIFDEMTSNLDVVTEKKLMDTIKNLNNGITVIIIAHRLSTILCCDTISFMKKGRIIANGTHKELISNCREYREFWEVNTDLN